MFAVSTHVRIRGRYVSINPDVATRLFECNSKESHVMSYVVGGIYTQVLVWKAVELAGFDVLFFGICDVLSYFIFSCLFCVMWLLFPFEAL